MREFVARIMMRSQKEFLMLKRILEAGEIQECYGIEGYAALHVVNGKPKYQC